MPKIFTKKNLKRIFHEIVAAKAGSKGIDGIGVAAFEARLEEHIDVIHAKIHNTSFKFSPFLEVLLSKGRDKPPRMISIPTLRDKIVLQALHQYLRHKFPNNLPTRLPNTYIHEIKNNIFDGKINYDCVRRYDISDFYPSINSKKLMERIKEVVNYPTVLNILSSALNTPTVSRGTKKDQYKHIQLAGVPQGLSISNILSEIYMSEFDNRINTLPIKYWRYVDDILILCKDSQSEETHAAVQEAANNLNLNCDNDKFKTCTLDKDFSYLGYKINSKSISVKPKSLESHIQKIIDIFRWYDKSKSDPKIDLEILKQALVDSINERITGAISGKKRYGWLFYFSEITDKSILYKIDAVIRKKFLKCPDFKSTPPNLKRSVRAYHEIIHSPHGGYIHDYNKYVSAKERFDFLVSRCVIPTKDSYRRYPVKEIHIRFYQYRNKQLSRLRRDIGVFS